MLRQAGPPFKTDDPEPAPYRGWEIYAGGVYSHDLDVVSAEIPFIDANYGLMPNVQVTVGTPVSYERTPSARGTYRYAQTEAGIKVRFISEASGRPQVSFYPSVELSSTGEKPRTLLPLWLQKSSGRWTIFGGGGLQIDPNDGARNSVFTGVAALDQVREGLSIGGEVFRQTSSQAGQIEAQTGFNLGLIQDIGAHHAFLFSIGRSVGGANALSTYGSYEFRLGREPAEEAPPARHPSP